MLSVTHQKFAERIAAGESATAAYAAAFPRCTNQRSAAVGGSRLLQKADIIAEVQRIRREAEKLPGGAVLTVAEKRRFLARLIRANLSSVPVDSDLWQEFHVSDGGTKRKLPDKLRAIALDNDLAADGSQAHAQEAAVDVVDMLAQLMGVRT